jgi:hypothetical protein
MGHGIDLAQADGGAEGRVLDEEAVGGGGTALGGPAQH